jgi:5-azacytidine-induced protein 1
MKAVRMQLQARRYQIQQMDEEIAEISKAVSKSKPTSRAETRPSSAKKPAQLNSSSRTDQRSMKPQEQTAKYVADLRLKKPAEQTVKHDTRPRQLRENESRVTEHSESFTSIPSSDKASERASSILQYLEDSESDFPSIGQIEKSSVPLAEAAKYQAELQESAKTVATLKAIVERQKARLQERTEELQVECERRLALQKGEFESLTEKNMEFLQSLLKEKEEFLKEQSEGTRRLRETDRRHLKEVEELKTQFEREMKKQKEIWLTSEKIRRENWLKEKTKEIKEATARGLEPEIARMMSDQRQVMERAKEQHRVELKALRDEMTEEKDTALREARTAGVKEADRRVEQERRTYADKISELLGRQEAEMAEMRRRINDEITKERSKTDQVRSASDEQWNKRLSDLEQFWAHKLQSALAEEKATQEDTRRKHSCEVMRLREEHSAEMGAWLEVQHNKLNKEFKDKAEAVKADLVAGRDAELKKVIERLSAEQVELKKRHDSDVTSKLKAANDRHLDEVQDFLGKISTLKAQCNQAYAAAADWEAKARDLGQEVEDMNNYLSEKDQTINDLERHIEQLQLQVEGQDSYVKSAVKRTEDRHEAAQARLISELKATQGELSKVQTTHLHELEMLSQREAEGYAAIEHRVRQTVQKKDDKIRELTEKLKVAQVKAQKLEELLESQRRELTLL